MPRGIERGPVHGLLLLGPLLSGLLANFAAADPAAARHSLYEGRGFLPGHCYQHPAIRRCRAKPVASCDLELFPARTGALHFALDAARDSLLPGKDSTDFGLFEFKVDSVGGPGPAQALILKITDIPLRKWEAAQDAEATGREIPCHARST